MSLRAKSADFLLGAVTSNMLDDPRGQYSHLPSQSLGAVNDAIPVAAVMPLVTPRKFIGISQNEYRSSKVNISVHARAPSVVLTLQWQGMRIPKQQKIFVGYCTRLPFYTNTG